MGKRLTRKDIKKKDPITEFLQGLWNTGLENRKYIVIAVSVVLGAIVLYLAFTMLYLNSAANRAQALQKAMDVYGAKVDTTLTQKKDDTYPSAEAKFKDALAGFQKVSGEYGTSEEGLLASYYESVCLRELGRPAEAEPKLKQVVEEWGSSQMGQVARMALADVYRSQRKYGEAVQILDSLEKEAAPVFSAESIVFTRASYLEAQGKYQAALDLLKKAQEGIKERRKSDEKFASPYESAIARRIEILKAKLDSGAPATTQG